MGAADAEGRRPRRRQAGQRGGPREARRLVARRQLTLDNTIAAELAGSEDTVLRELEERLGCELFLRGNVLTLDGDDADVRRAATMVDELVGLVERGHELAPATIDTVTGAIAADEKPGRDPRGRGLAPPRHQGRAEDRQPEALRRLDPPPHGHLRDRPGGHRQDLPRGRDGGRRARGARGQPDHPHPARRSRPASGSASCPATSRRRSTPTCARSSTRSTTCSTRSRCSTYFDRGMIEVAPLAFMRGRTLNDSFVILDEAQNTSPEQMKMFLTRLGFGSKMVVTGDITQIDLPRDQRSGPGRRRRDPRRGRRHRLRPLRRRGRRPPPARAADRRRLRRVLASATERAS